LAWTYTKSTNLAVVTGTDTISAGLLAADRAGSVTLLAAWAPNNNTKALTYQITPVEKLALLISFVVASKTAEADYIFITGTDAWDAAQTESIDVTAGNGTYVSTKRFRTITNIDCSDNAAGGGTVWADGTVAVTQPQWGVIWDWSAAGAYRIDCKMQIGDGTTSTFVTETSKALIIGPNVTTANGQTPFWVKNNANFTLGAVGDASKKTTVNPCYVLNLVSSYLDFICYSESGATGFINSYGTKWANLPAKAYYVYHQGTAASRFWNNSLDSIGFYLCASNGDYFNNLVNGSAAIYNCFGDSSQTRIVQKTGVTYSFIISTTGTVTYSNVWAIGANAVFQTLSSFSGTANIVNLINDVAWTCSFNTSATGSVYRQYTCDINVCDKDGDPLPDVTVDCEDTTGTAVWTAGSVTTDVNGDITQQTINYTKYTAGATTATPTIATYSSHKFTISKAGYETLVMENITLDAPIDWRVEVQAPPVSPSYNIGI